MKTRFPILFFTIILIGSSASQCKDDVVQNAEEVSACEKGVTPAWVNEIINTAKQDIHKSEVIRYTYEGKVVYLVNTCTECVDFITEVYDCQQNVICKFGGFAGFNTCPEFAQKASAETVIWRN